MNSRTMLVSLGMAGLLAGAVGGVAPPASAAAPPLVAGGTNYNWYKLNGCDREPYGVVQNYDQAKSTIDRQLQAIYDSGQRRLNIAMFHIHGVEDGTLMNSAGGKLTPKDHKNLADLLAEMKHIGFPKVVITMNPEGANLPTNPDYDPSTYDENFSFLKDVRSVAVASGEPYTIDLYDEVIPENDPNNPGQVNALNYSTRLWADYTKAFGKADTTGFSIIGGDPLRFASLAKVYQGN
ncbi:MAG TPA: hypothetical protein VHC49_23600, partial [Mycobacteriales bacterium]|nr:hypothetical protein [Mycobacteriales bacterium]